jgi:Flp pilus assembly protein TadG
MLLGSTLRNRRPGKGASAVEFAIVAPVFFMIVLGLIEMGRALMVMEQLTEASRRACRVAVIDGTSSATIKQAAVDYLTSVGIQGETAGISINDAPVDTIEAMNMPSYTEITVVITIPVASCTWLPGGEFLSGNLSGQYTMRRE